MIDDEFNIIPIVLTDEERARVIIGESQPFHKDDHVVIGKQRTTIGETVMSNEKNEPEITLTAEEERVRLLAGARVTAEQLLATKKRHMAQRAEAERADPVDANGLSAEEKRYAKSFGVTIEQLIQNKARRAKGE